MKTVLKAAASLAVIAAIFVAGGIAGRITWLNDEESTLLKLNRAGITAIQTHNIGEPSKLATFTGVLSEDPTCHVSGFRSASGGNWVLFGYEGPSGEPGRDWPSGDLAQAARAQPTICHTPS